MAVLLLRQLKVAQLTPIISVAANRLLSDKVITLEIDESGDIDTFTSELLQKKSNKWDYLLLKKKFKESGCNLINHRSIDVNVAALSKPGLDKLLQNSLEDGNQINIRYLINECTEKKRCPSLGVLLSVLDNYSRHADVEMIKQIQALTQEVDHETYTGNARFNHYLAEALWLRGDVTRALEIFEVVYGENIYLRRRVRLMLKFLILDVTSRSEAVLVNLVKFSQRVLREYKDFFPLTCVWQACFLSEWFTDQMLALDLLEKNDGLCKVLVNSIPYVVYESLRSHRTEVIYRLMEILLKYDMKMQYSVVLVALFDYRLRQGNIRSCSEIIQWSVTYKVLLPTSLHTRFLMLLLNKSDYGKSPKKVKTPDYQLKF